MWLFSPNFDAKSIIFPNFGQGPFPKIAGKGPDIEKSWKKSSTNNCDTYYQHSNKEHKTLNLINFNCTYDKQ